MKVDPAVPASEEKKDAARYRWLRAQKYIDIGMAWFVPMHEETELTPEAMDAAIDAQMRAEGVQPGELLGWKLVPPMPTVAMLSAMAECDGYRDGDRDRPGLTRWEDYWLVAFAAAPLYARLGTTEGGTDSATATARQDDK